MLLTLALQMAAVVALTALPLLLARNAFVVEPLAPVMVEAPFTGTLVPVEELVLP